MSEENERPSVVFWSAILATALSVAASVGYGSAYALMVNGPRYFDYSGVGPWILPPDYRGERRNRDQQFWMTVFGPAHWVDQRIRRAKWIIE